MSIGNQGTEGREDPLRQIKATREPKDGGTTRQLQRTHDKISVAQTERKACLAMAS